jgi:hypothetical protein
LSAVQTGDATRPSCFPAIIARVSTAALTPLQHESNLALQKFAEKGGTNTVVIPANMQTAPLIQIGGK